jgi:type IV pilus assembly protein PilA
MNSSQHRSAAFTLVEIMIVVALVGLLAAIALPNFARARSKAQRTRFISDLRIARAAFEQYTMENGSYPADNLPGIVPPGMEEHLARMRWTDKTPIGGYWDWDYNQFGFVAGVSVYRPSRSDSEMAVIDAEIDDGALSTGYFRKRLNGFISIIEPQKCVS